MANGPISYVDPNYHGDPLAPLRERIHKLELISTDKDALSKFRGEIYEHVGKLLTDNRTAIMEKVEDKMVNARGAILSDVDKLGGDLHRAVTDGVKEAFSNFIEKDLPLIIEAQLQARDDRKEAERERKIGKLRTRLAVGTSAALFLASVFNFYLTTKGKDNSAAVNVQKSVTQLEKLVKP